MGGAQNSSSISPWTYPRAWVFVNPRSSSSKACIRKRDASAFRLQCYGIHRARLGARTRPHWTSSPSRDGSARSGPRTRWTPSTAAVPRSRSRHQAGFDVKKIARGRAPEMVDRFPLSAGVFFAAVFLNSLASGAVLITAAVSRCDAARSRAGAAANMGSRYR